METLKIRNFGPVKELDIIIKPFTVFVGDQGSGKSTISKLLTILRDMRWYIQVLKETEEVMKPFIEFNISEYFQADSYISYINKNNDTKATYQNGVFKAKIRKLSAIKAIEYCQNCIQFANLDYRQKDIANLTPNAINEKVMRANCRMSLYIPAERNLIGNLSSALASIMLAEIPLSNTLMEYMSLFEKAKKQFPQYDIPFLGVTLKRINGRERIVIADNGKDLPLDACSSGLQSVIPMLMVIDYALALRFFDSFVIEEPEQNLFPRSQRELLNFIVAKRSEFTTCILTTHSPYLLSSLNVLLLASKLNKNIDIRDRVSEVIHLDVKLDPESVAVYGLDPNSDCYCKNLISEKTGIISMNSLDAVSEHIGDDFNKLYSLYLQTLRQRK